MRARKRIVIHDKFTNIRIIQIIQEECILMNDELQKERIRILRQRTDRLEHEGDFWTKDEIKMLVNGFNDCVGIT